MAGSTSGGSRKQFGVFTLDAHAGELRKQGTRIKLQERPLQVLVSLLERPGEVVTREELRERLWPDGTFVDFDHSISTAVNKLRNALNDSAAHPRYVETVGRRGYRFVYPVSAVARVLEQEASAGEPAARRLPLPLFVGLALFVIGVIVLFARGDLTRDSSPGTSAIRSIAVLPLRNLSTDPDQEFFSEGLTDELITRLASVEGLRVISRTSAMQYKDSSKPLPTIAKELNVDAVLQGSVLRADGRVRITAQLLDAAADRHVWAQSYERDHRDILDLQYDVARDIAAAISAKLRPAAAAIPRRDRPLNPEAHQAYLRARHRWYTRRTEELQRAIIDFERALSVDPEYALAHAGLADVYLVLPLLTGEVPQEEAYAKAKEAADRAIALDPSLAEAHNSSAYLKLYLSWDFEGAERGFRKAIELNPGYATAHQWYAELLSFQARHAEAIVEIRKALELDPLSAVMHHQAGQTYQQARQYEQAIQEYNNALALLPTFRAPSMFMGLAYRRQGRLKEAADAMAAAFREQEQIVSELTAVAARGDLNAYLRTERKLAAFLARPAYYHGLYDAALGNDLQAFRWLDKALERRDECLLYLKVDPEWDRLRSDRRFKALMQKVGLL